MNAYRLHELDHPPLRSGRFRSVENRWYATTRERRELGPFQSREQAKMAVAAYVAEIAPNEYQPAIRDVAADPDSIAARLQELRQFIRVREEHGIAVALVWVEGRLKRLEGECPFPADRKERVEALEHLLGMH